jgi:hypothetical protein
MNAVTRLSPPSAGLTSPAASLHVSEVTVAAVDQIGNATSDQIRHTAERIETEAKQIGDRLRELADAFDEQTRLASQKISDFCLKMSSARDIVRGLETQVTDKPPGA